MTGIELIAKERQEQIEKHGRTIIHDVICNKRSQLINAVDVLIYENLNNQSFNSPKGWDVEVFKKMTAKPYKERLIIAGALIAAEIDRIDNLDLQDAC